MPRKPSEIDVIDGIIFQSFETSEGMEGCFQYTGPSLPVKVRRTSRERKTKFRIKEGILSPKKKLFLPEELQTPEQLHPAVNSLSVTKFEGLDKKRSCQHCSSYSSRYNGSPAKTKRKILDVGVGKCSDCFVSDIDAIQSDNANFGDQADFSSDSMPVLSEEWCIASSSQDADSIQDSSDQVDEIDVKRHLQATQNTKRKTKTKKKKKRKRLNNMYHGVKFGFLSCRIKGKSKKKTNKASCTVTSLEERESNSCQDDSFHSHWMTPPDGPNNAQGPSGLRISLKKVTRELVFEPGEKTEDQWVGVTPCTSPDKKKKRKKRKQKTKLKLLKSESCTNSSNNSLSARTDWVEPSGDFTNLKTGDLKLVEVTGKCSAFQSSSSSVDSGYSVMLSPETMDMPTLKKEHEPALEACSTPHNNHSLSFSGGNSRAKAEELYSTELERLLTSPLNITPQPGSETQLFATSKGKRKKTLSKKQAIKKPRKTQVTQSSAHVKTNAASPHKDRSGSKRAKRQNRNDCYKNDLNLHSLDAGSDSDHVKGPPVLTPQRQLKGRKRYTQNHLDIGPDLSPPRLSPAFVTSPSSTKHFVYPETEFKEQTCKLPKRETLKKAAEGKKKLRKMQNKALEPPSITQESVEIKQEQIDHDFLPSDKSKSSPGLVSSNAALITSHEPYSKTDPRCRTNSNQSQHQPLDVSQDKNHSKAKILLSLPGNTSPTMQFLRDHTSSTASDTLNCHTSRYNVKGRGKRERQLSTDATLDKVKPSKKKKQKRASICTLLPSGSAFTGNTFINSAADENNISSLNSLLNVKEKQISVGQNHTKVEPVPYLSPRCVPKRTIKRPARYEQDKADGESRQKPHNLVKESSPFTPCDSSISPSSSPQKQRRNSASYQRPSAKKKRKASLDVIAHLQYSSPSAFRCQDVQEMCVTSSSANGKFKQLLTRTVSLQVPDDLKIGETLSSQEQKPSEWRQGLNSSVGAKKQNHSTHPRGKVNDLCSKPCATGLPPGGKFETSSGGTQTSEIDFYLADFSINYPK